MQYGTGHVAHAAIWPFGRGNRKRKGQAQRQKNVLVLMSDTGGGHKASAQAIEAGFKQMYGDKCVLFTYVLRCLKSTVVSERKHLL